MNIDFIRNNFDQNAKLAKCRSGLFEVSEDKADNRFGTLDGMKIDSRWKRHSRDSSPHFHFVHMYVCVWHDGQRSIRKSSNFTNPCKLTCKATEIFRSIGRSWSITSECWNISVSLLESLGPNTVDQSRDGVRDFIKSSILMSSGLVIEYCGVYPVRSIPLFATIGSNVLILSGIHRCGRLLRQHQHADETPRSSIFLCARLFPSKKRRPISMALAILVLVYFISLPVVALMQCIPI